MLSAAYRPLIWIRDRSGVVGDRSRNRVGGSERGNPCAIAAGDHLDAVTDEVRKRLGLELRILPMSNEPCPTFVELDDGRSIHFEEYLVRDRAPTNVKRVDLCAARRATPAPRVLESIERADTILVCPSNPIVSIDPILSVRGIAEALRRSPAPVIAVSPIVGGAPIKGPAHTLLAAASIEVSAAGVAGYYRDWIDGFIFDVQDRALGPEIEKLGLAVDCLDTIMVDAAVSERVARAAITLAQKLRGTKQPSGHDR